MRSFAEAVELAGVALAVLSAPAVAPVATAGPLWFLGGRSGASVVRAALGRRLYRTPVDDVTRERWLQRERTAVVVFSIAALLAAAIRYL